MEENSKHCVPENRGNTGKDESAHREVKKEIQERKQNGVKTTGVLMRKELISVKAQNQIHNRPTLPHILTAYGLQDDVAIKKKEKKEHSKRRKKKETFYEDDSEKDRERDMQKEERHLQIVRDLERLRDYYYDEYTRLLENKVNKQKQEIRERSDAFLNKIMEFKETERRESHRVKRRLGRHTLISDISFLNNIPKTDVFHIIQLQDKMAKEGKLRTQSDYDEFWQQMQNPKVFNTYFKMPKNTIDSSSFNENAPIDNRQKFPSETSFPIHTSVSGTTGPPIWATSTARIRRKSFISDLEKRFPKLEMPTLHCFTMDLGPKPPDPKTISFERHLHKLEKKRKDYLQKLTKMHQYAMIHNAATSRILEKHQDLDLEGSKLTDLISDYYFYLGQRHSPTETKESLSSVLKAAPNLDVLSLGSPASAADSLAEFDDRAVGTKQNTPTSSKQTAECKAVSIDSQAISIDEKPQTETFPLTLVDLATHDRIMEAKCLSTLWINYAKNQTAET